MKYSYGSKLKIQNNESVLIGQWCVNLMVVNVNQVITYYIKKTMDWAYNSDQDVFSEDSFPLSQASQEEEEEEIQGGEIQKMVQKLTPEQILELGEDNVSCQICCKYALNAVICTNSKCKKLFCNSCVNSTKSNLQNKCPFCRNQPFSYEPSPYATAINTMELLCSLCKEKYILEQEQKHYKLNCQYFHRMQCRYCEQKIQKKEIVKHTKQHHIDRLDQIIQNLYSCPPPEPNSKKILEKNKAYLQKIDRRPQLGTSGKFYCGGKLQTKCSCCNGYCGPTNGQNCTECMKLDIKKFGLPKGYLVNSNGIVCFKSGNDFICGVKLYYEQGQCSEGNTCRPCANMKRNIKRYQDLL